MLNINNDSVKSISFNGSGVTSLVFNGVEVWSLSQPSVGGVVTLTLTGGTTSSVTYSDGIVPNSAFTGNLDIVAVDIGSGITRVNSNAFAQCSNISSVTIADTVTRLGGYTFSGCTALTEVVIPDSVTEFGGAVFYYCSGLTSVTIGSGFTTFSNPQAFAACSSLTSITINATTAPTLYANTFLAVPSVGILYVPYGSDYSSWIGTGATSTTQLASGWTIQDAPLADFDVKLILTGGTIENHTYSSGTIPNNEFYQRYDIVGVKMGSGITSIGEGAFYRCSGITQLEIGDGVTNIGLYAFWNCTSVSSATLGNSLVSVDEFGLAFCSSAITSIEFPSTLINLSANSIRGNSAITSITCNAVEAPFVDENSFIDYPSQGTLYVPYGSDYSSWIGSGATSGDKLASGWTIESIPPEPIDYSREYLTFVAEADNMSVGLTYAGDNVFQYSTDNGSTWNNLSINHSTTSVNAGQKIMFKATGVTINTTNGIGDFKPSASASVEGNVMSLIYGDNFIGQETMATYQFSCLFTSASSITSAENLVLPATTLTGSCYNNMFKGCTSLTTAPELPATTLAGSCYQYMFSGCTSLTTAPSILPATTLASSCYSNMFQGCTSLTTAPELSATKLVTYCYNYMFGGCSSLNSITCLATNISAYNCLNNWVNGVASSGTFTKAASMTSWRSGVSGIPNGWSIVDAS